MSTPPTLSPTWHPSTAESVSLDLPGPTLVVGLGRSGMSAVRTLVALGAEVEVSDSRTEPPELPNLLREFPELSCHLGGFRPEAFARAARLVVSPGVAVRTPVIAAAQARGTPIWGDIELFVRLAKAPVAAITGSNGKSTVTTLLGNMIEQAGIPVAVGGNLGTPALDLLRMRPTPALYVLELSSFQLETTHSLDAQAATVLNISADHMDRYVDLASYAQAKQRVFRGSGWQIINADDRRVNAMVDASRPIYRFTLNTPGPEEFGLRRRADGAGFLAFGDEDWLAVEELRIRGAHNWANALAALALGRALDVPRAASLDALRSFSGLPHRTEWVRERQGVHWFNDSKGTNVGSTLAAVQGLPGPLILIAGGDGKGQDFAPLGPALADKVRDLVLIGRDAPLIAAVAGNVPTHRAADMEQAVTLAARLAQAGDSVLLSPACASFDMFSNYEERGAIFTAAVHNLPSC
ncbi:MAG: UDP-N-acetylmuramoyl-L-alanine--D-glutamate ligase [Gammaproteobacteria bacterium]|nr:UDP-N-acetylmuramoyl-L-alanine--D-glutamate ligase [Gammaproteobacteria bacterium]MCP5423748.1 UDP-N-acetylmuramoyl-L-alanine--D-glutamate ligase [Gammaproteobacteria bacterium]MCP5459670.1 UDP-N-acetylmuramoyl-L-alanine--D-glutamate ligase [Gammaproteobacteria bacterium]